MLRHHSIRHFEFPRLDLRLALVVRHRQCFEAGAIGIFVETAAFAEDLIDFLAEAEGDLGFGLGFRETELDEPGEKLRASNVMLPVVVGCGFESAAYQSLRSVPVPTVWPRSEPLKWVAALDLRRRSLADEYVAAARAERGLFLGLFAELEKASAGGGRIPRWSPFRRVFLARAKLEPCEAMQGMLLALGGKPVDLGRIARFEAYAADKRHKNDPALEFGLWMLVGVRRGIHEALLQQDSARLRWSRSWSKIASTPERGKSAWTSIAAARR